jgi:hypothetical protein
MDWYLALTSSQPKPPTSPIPKLSPNAALIIGLLDQLRFQPRTGQRQVIDGRLYHWGAPDAEMLLLGGRTEAARLRRSLRGDLAGLVKALEKSPDWRERIRRCDYKADHTACYRYFPDRSQGRRARACSPEHSVRLIEDRGALAPRPRRRRGGVKFKR